MIVFYVHSFVVILGTGLQGGGQVLYFSWIMDIPLDKVLYTQLFLFTQVLKLIQTLVGKVKLQLTHILFKVLEKYLTYFVPKKTITTSSIGQKASLTYTFIYLFYLFIWGFTSLSTLYRSYHDG